MLSRLMRCKAHDLCLLARHHGAAAHRSSTPSSIFATRRRTSSDASNNHIESEAGISLTGDLPRLPWQRKPDTRNIVVDDLEATIDAHRRSNLTGISDAKNVVRRVPGVLGVRRVRGVRRGRRALKHRTFSSNDESITGENDPLNPHQRIPSPLLGGEWASDPTDNLGAVEDLLSASSNEDGIEQALFDEKENLKVTRKKKATRKRHLVRSPAQRRLTRDGHASPRRQLKLQPPPWPPANYIGSYPSRTFKWNSYGMSEETRQDWSSHTATRPWIRGLGYDMDSGQRLHQEIEAFEQYLAQTADESIAIEASMTRMQSLIANLLPSHELVLHGSRATGMAIATSDVDYSVTVPGFDVETAGRGPSRTNPQARKAANRVLEKIQEALRRDESYWHVNRIHARIPLITAIDKRLGLKFQFQTLAAVTSSREYCIYYLNELPSLRPLLLVIRHGLQIRGLCSVFGGGLGTYSLLMMIVAALKHEPRIQSEDFGGQLKHVLRFYADADLETRGFAIEPPATFAKRTSTQPSDNLVFDAINLRSRDAPYLLCLQDPANPRNDLGHKAHQIKNVQVTFATWLRQMGKEATRWDRDEPQARLAQSEGKQAHCILGPVAAAVFQHFEDRRMGILGNRVLRTAHEMPLHKYLI